MNAKSRVQKRLTPTRKRPLTPTHFLKPNNGCKQTQHGPETRFRHRQQHQCLDSTLSTGDDFNDISSPVQVQYDFGETSELNTQKRIGFKRGMERCIKSIHQSLTSCAANSVGLPQDDGKPLEDNVFQTPVKRMKRKLDDSTHRTNVLRFRLGSLGDRCSLSPPDMTIRDIRRVKLKRLLGSGGFGSVYLGVFKDRIVAVKKLHRCIKNVRAKVESFRAECNVLNLKHPNIIRILAASVGDPRKEAIVVMEYAGECNLQGVIDDLHIQMPFEKRVKYSLDVARALQFIHGNHVVHLDLKPANILITSRDGCKLGDFGCCRVLETDSSLRDRVSPPPNTCLGTFAYRAPELLRGDVASTKADIYSLGITMWQMLTRKTPYAGEDHHVVIFGVVAYNVRPRINQPIDAADRCFADLFIQCWNADPNVRPNPSDLIEIFPLWLEHCH